MEQVERKLAPIRQSCTTRRCEAAKCCLEEDSIAVKCQLT